MSHGHLDHSITTQPRSAGVLMHPTSLPGAYGIGSFGPESDRFIDFLITARQRLWQMCPLGPTGYADSPYQCFSAFAGNPMLIGLEQLRDAGLLEEDDLADAPAPPDAAGAPDDPHAAGARVDYGAVIPWKSDRLRRAFDRFRTDASAEARAAVETFRNESAHWLPDYALFMTLKEAHDLSPWTDWEAELRDRDTGAIDRFADANRDRIDYHVWLQWVFRDQWSTLRSRANSADIRLVGDMPIFVAHDSADVWARRDLFKLDEKGNPLVMAGVPPDYFSETGQLWGNPIYEWERHRETGFQWWYDVITSKFALYDHVRIDHFRGFSAYWSIPQGETTAINGEWVPSPGEELFTSLEKRIGRMPLIAEDLGVITDDVVELINVFGFARMKVLQFAFDSDEQNDYLPHTYQRNAVVYTGTHDNDTTAGWLEHAKETDREYALRYVHSDGTEPHWDFIRAAIASTAQFAVVPMQDLLGLGSRARMNTPGTTGGNWSWRMAGDVPAGVAERLAEMTTTYGRI